MRSKWMIALLAALLAVIAIHTLPALAEAGDDEAEWTVLFYMCGSDLEFKYGYGTENLEDIAKCVYPQRQVEDLIQVYGDVLSEDQLPKPGRVNVLIETGGCKQWHAQKLGMSISSKALQRWRYECYQNDEKPDGFFLEQSLPLRSMADPETLSDFVRWGAENYPARKYALVLWDHGGGSKTGIFVDELFGGDVMYLDELGSALRDSGVHLEAVLFDACLMAGLETAYAISDSANWMIASEEVVAGKGTAVDRWLQQIYIAPSLDGEWLGRWICDMTQIKYANEDDEQAQQLLTWSVIDLSRIPQLVEMFDRGFNSMGVVYARYPRLMSAFAKYILQMENYGTSEGDEKMWDLAGFFYAPETSMMMPTDMLRETLTALKEAVVYCVRGSGRSAARGLSYCYAVSFDTEELEVYARNCPMPHYLALLDAITPWTAPDWVYETAERLPELSKLDQYRVILEKVRWHDDMPGLSFVGNYDAGVGMVRYRMFRKDEDTGDILLLGIMPTYYDDTIGEKGVYTAVEPWMWPALEGQPIPSYVINNVEPGSINYLGSIPIRIGTEQWFLRYGYFGAEDHYTVYGLWAGYETDSKLFNRNVKSLSQMAGQEYSLLYPVYTSDYEKLTNFSVAEPQTLYRAMLLEDRLLPPGTYYIQYMVYDMFMRPMPLEWIEFEWDGEHIAFPDDFAWEGTEELAIPEAYW